MGGYVVNFTVYTMAMAGLICFAVFVYKKVMDGSFRSNDSNFLGIEETISLNPRKTLHVVRAGNEKFLIAADIDRTTLISKLGQKSQVDLTQNSCSNIFEQNLSYTGNEVFEEIKRPQPPTDKRVHLEPVRTKNPQASHIRRGMDRREDYRPVKTKTVELDFETPKNHGFSTMREMAKKINEL